MQFCFILWSFEACLFEKTFFSKIRLRNLLIFYIFSTISKQKGKARFEPAMHLSIYPCTAPNQLRNSHTGSGLHLRHRSGLYRWRLCSGDCSPWTNQTAFSDAWRSSDPLMPRTRTKLGERSFRISAPTVWNSLPYSLKHSATSREHFRKELKTYLFRKAYSPASENYWRVNLLTYILMKIRSWNLIVQKLESFWLMTHIDFSYRWHWVWGQLKGFQCSKWIGTNWKAVPVRQMHPC